MMQPTSQKIVDLHGLISLEESEEVRRERLSLARQLQQIGLVFRSYRPMSEVLRPLMGDRITSEKTERMLTDAIAPLLRRAEEEINMVPPRANWDLKRSIEPQLNELERQTMRSLAEMLQRKLDAEKGEARVGVGQQQQRSQSLSAEEPLTDSRMDVDS